MSKQAKLVVVGNGMAGMRVVDELLRLAPERYQITVIGAEPRGNYNRIMLSPVLAGEKTIDDIMTHTLSWYAERGITLEAGAEKAVTSIDRAAQQVQCVDGTRLDYDKLVLAVGSEPLVLNIPGMHLPGVGVFRDIDDVNRMLAASQSQQRALVIGGGLLGLEAANGLRLQGMQVTVVHRATTLMNRQLDAVAGSLLKNALEDRGLSFLLDVGTTALKGQDRVTTACFDNGTELETDLVVMTIGIQPNVSLGQASGLQCQRGICVDDQMQTSDPNIYAVGECVEHQGATFGLVAPLYEQAKVCAQQLNDQPAAYQQSASATVLKVTGLDVYSFGDIDGAEDTESITFQDKAQQIYKKLVLRQDRIVGGVLFGHTVDGAWFFDLMNRQVDIQAIRELLIFGRAYIDDEWLAEQA